MANYAAFGPAKDYDGTTDDAKKYEYNNSSVLGRNGTEPKNNTPVTSSGSGGYTHKGNNFSNWSDEDFNLMRSVKRDEEANPGGANSDYNRNTANYLRNKYGYSSDTFSSADMDEWERYNKAYGDNKNTKKADDMLSGFYTKYENQPSRDLVESAYNDLENFSYNPENDAMFQAYKDRYLRESAEAQDSTYANLSAFTGGRNNSWASQAVAQVGQSYAQKIADVIPTLAENAYNKLLQKYNTAKDMYNTEVSEWEREFNRDTALYDMYRNADATVKDNARAAITQGQNDAIHNRNITSMDIANLDAGLQYKLNEKYGDSERAAAAYTTYLNNIGMELANRGVELNNTQLSQYVARYPELLQLMIDDASADVAVKQWQAILGQMEATYYPYTL